MGHYRLHKPCRGSVGQLGDGERLQLIEYETEGSQGIPHEG